jgi:hypothetical protein
MKQLYVWLLPIAAVLLAPFARACSCVGRADCGAFKIRDTCFVGKALSVHIIQNSLTGTQFIAHRRIYQFEVSEPLTGELHTSEVIEIETGMGGGVPCVETCLPCAQSG